MHAHPHTHTHIRTRTRIHTDHYTLTDLSDVNDVVLIMIIFCLIEKPFRYRDLTPMGVVECVVTTSSSVHSDNKISLQ